MMCVVQLALNSSCVNRPELEADLIRDRTIAGLNAARRRGQRLGRKPVLDANARRRAARLRASGHSVRDIAAQLECGVATVHRALKSQEASDEPIIGTSTKRRVESVSPP